MSFLTFLNPSYLFLLFLVPLVIWFYYFAFRKKRQAAIHFSHLGLLKEAGAKPARIREHLHFLFLFLSILLLIFALADPRVPLSHIKEGVNVVLVIDVSGSMQANDYTPSRLEAAKSAAETFVSSLEPKDQAGVVIFESGATTAAYLSPFKDRVIDKIKSITPHQGSTAIGDGLSLAVDMATSIPNQKKAIILLSDGANNAGVVSPQEAIAYAKANQVPVSTVALGSNGKAVLGYDFFGNPIYADLDEAALQSIAKETGGQYYKSVDSTTLHQIYQTLGQNIKREREPVSIKDWFLYAALLLSILHLYLSYGKYRILA